MKRTLFRQMRKTLRIDEAVRGAANNPNMTYQTFIAFADAFIPDTNRRGTYVKILQFVRGQQLPVVYDAYYQNNDIVHTNKGVYIKGIRDSQQDPVTLANLIADYTAVVQSDSVQFDAESQVMVELDDTQHPVKIVFEDRTDTVFLVADTLTNAGKSWRDVTQYVTDLTDLVHSVTSGYQLSQDALTRILGNDTARQNLTQDQLNMLVTFLPEQQRAQYLQQPAEQPQAEPQQAEQPQAEQPVQQQQQAAGNQAQAPEQAPEQAPAQDAAAQDNKVFGQTFLGEWNREEHNVNDTAVLMGPWPVGDMQAEMQRLIPSPDALKSLFDKQFTYRQINLGDPNGAKKAYLDVYRNFKFFVFNASNDIRWWQTRLQLKALFKWQSQTATDMWRKLSANTPNGNEFIGFFYGRIKGEQRAAAAQGREPLIHTLWSSDGKTQALAPSAKKQIPPRQRQIDISDEDRRKLEAAMKSVNGKLAGVGIDVQITVPGHGPNYTWIPELGSAQGQGWPDGDERYFVVMFPGMETETKYFGLAAEKYLQDTGLIREVGPALEAAKAEYQGIVPAIVFDNGIE